MKYTLKIFNLNLNTNEYEQVNTITCDDEKEANELLLALYKDRDFKPSARKYKFKYTKESINITCKFLQPTRFESGDSYDFKYTCKYKHEYQFFYY